MATTFWFSMYYNFGYMIASDTLLDFRGGFSGSSYPIKTQPISRFQGTLPWQPLLAFYTRCTLVPPGEYDWTGHVRRRYGLMSNYFDHLLLLLLLILIALNSQCLYASVRGLLNNYNAHVKKTNTIRQASFWVVVIPVSWYSGSQLQFIIFQLSTTHPVIFGRTGRSEIHSI